MLGNSRAFLFLVVALGWSHAGAFTASLRQQPHHGTTTALFGSDMGMGDNNDLLLVREFLQKNFPNFYSLLDTNEEVWKAIGDTEDGNEVGFTVFAPNEEALNNLGAEKVAQLMDERNVETTSRIIGYHVIGEPVNEETLFNAGGVVTVSGEVPIERTVSGGVFGIGGKEDGGVALNNARVLRTARVGAGLVHEVDGIVAPNIMWRYMDQLRIPGTT